MRSSQLGGAHAGRVKQRLTCSGRRRELPEQGWEAGGGGVSPNERTDRPIWRQLGLALAHDGLDDGPSLSLGRLQSPSSPASGGSCSCGPRWKAPVPLA